MPGRPGTQHERARSYSQVACHGQSEAVGGCTSWISWTYVSKFKGLVGLPAAVHLHLQSSLIVF